MRLPSPSLAIALLVPALAIAAPYDCTVLPAPGFAAGASAVNNLGQVVGYSFLPDGSDIHAMLWQSDGTGADIGTLGGTESEAYAINDAGDIAGAGYDATQAQFAIVWRGGVAHALAGVNGTAFGLNGAGQAVGQVLVPGQGYHAVLWTGDSAFLDLGTLGGPDSVASAINDAGQVVGAAELPTRAVKTHAASWTGTTLTDLTPAQVRGSSTASAINRGGLAVGWVPSDQGSHTQAATWVGGQTVKLLPLAGAVNSKAYGVNVAGAVVGVSETAAGGLEHAVMWNGALRPVDLNALVPAAVRRAGWVLTDAHGINDAGWIVGTAYNTLTSVERAYVIKPAVAAAD